MILLCKPKSASFVGRDELAKLFEDSEGGRWVELLQAASEFAQVAWRKSQRTEEEERVRRGQAAQSRVERGQVS